MVRIELTKANERFDDLEKRLDGADSSLHSLYEAILPWREACGNDVYPESYSVFTGDDSSFSSWKEIENMLPVISVMERKEGCIVIQGEGRILNHLIMLRIAVINGADLEITADSEISMDDKTLSNMEYIFSLHGISYCCRKSRVTLKHNG